MDRVLAAKLINMKNLSIADQMNACIKHANRKGLSIDSVNIYRADRLDNHNVIMYVGGERVNEQGLQCHSYISVAVLINAKNNTLIGAANESTWN